MSAPAYDSYRDSGLDWLGSLPSHWSTCKLKHVLSRMGSGGTPDTDRRSFWSDDETGTPWVAIGDMSGRQVVTSTAKRLTYDGRKSKRLDVWPRGTLLFSMYASLGHTAVAGTPLTVNQAILALVPKPSVNQLYLKRWLEFLRPHLSAEASSNTQDNLNASKVANLVVALPPPSEQAAIAAFLDREAGKIDALVQAQTRLIELLKEKRQAVISRAVTKGLDPAAPMKDSGVEWLGQVPAHWKVGPLRACLSQRSEKNENAANQNYLSLVAGRGVIPYADKGDMGNKKPEDLSRCKIVREGDIVINSMNFGIGSFGRSIYSGVCSPVYVVLYEADSSVDLDFTASIFATRSFQTYAQSFGNGILAHRSAIGWGELKTFQVGVPPIEEQHEILARLRAFDDYSLRLTSKVQSAIALLQERRAALISAAVTGKIDVRGFAPEQAEAA